MNIDEEISCFRSWLQLSILEDPDESDWMVGRKNLAQYILDNFFL